MSTVRSSADDFGKLLVRIALGLVLLPHGIWKVTNGIGFVAQSLASMQLPAALGYGVYVAEVVAPVLLIVGLWTRFAAAIVAFDMFMAFVLVLHPRMFAVKPQGGGLVVEVEAMFFLIALGLVFMGGGRYAITPDVPVRTAAPAPAPAVVVA
jgi:putative oxidoreductase